MHMRINLIFFLLIPIFSYSQEIVRESIGSNGASKSINNIHFNQSIGQQSALNGTVSYNNITLRQGFQQPVFRVEQNTLTDITELDIVVYPNPFKYDVGIKFAQKPIDNIYISIFDNRGKIIKNLSFIPQIEITIPCRELARGSYVLNITTSNKQYSTNIIKQ